MDNLKQHIEINPAIQNGQPVFSGTRVPVQTLFWHLEKGISIDEFLLDFPSVTKNQAIGVLGLVHKIFSSGKFKEVLQSTEKKNQVEYFLEEWAGFLSIEDVDKAKYEYLIEKYS